MNLCLVQQRLELQCVENVRSHGAPIFIAVQYSLFIGNFLSKIITLCEKSCLENEEVFRSVFVVSVCVTVHQWNQISPILEVFFSQIRFVWIMLCKFFLASIYCFRGRACTSVCLNSLLKCMIQKDLGKKTSQFHHLKQIDLTNSQRSEFLSPSLMHTCVV